MRIDTHCHLSKDDYDNVEEIIAHMAGNIMIASGDNKKSNLEVLDIIKSHQNIFGTIGYHPAEAEKITKKDLDLLEEQLQNSKIVGVGEIGLDYHYGKEDKEAQKKLFISQIAMARKNNLPIVIHSRDAALDTYEILLEYAKGMKMVMHCFSYSKEMAERFISLGVLLGIGGVVTFKNAKNLKEVVKNIDLAYLLLETDSPYLAPEPYRGMKNEPFYTKFVAEEIAKIKGMSYEKVLKVTTGNAIEEFDLTDKIC